LASALLDELLELGAIGDELQLREGGLLADVDYAG